MGHFQLLTYKIVLRFICLKEIKVMTLTWLYSLDSKYCRLQYEKMVVFWFWVIHVEPKEELFLFLIGTAHVMSQTLS